MFANHSLKKKNYNFIAYFPPKKTNNFWIENNHLFSSLDVFPPIKEKNLIGTIYEETHDYL
jgi:hypothetical protein